MGAACAVFGVVVGPHAESVRDAVYVGEVRGDLVDVGNASIVQSARSHVVEIVEGRVAGRARQLDLDDPDERGPTVVFRLLRPTGIGT